MREVPGALESDDEAGEEPEFLEVIDISKSYEEELKELQEVISSILDVWLKNDLTLLLEYLKSYKQMNHASKCEQTLMAKKINTVIILARLLSLPEYNLININEQLKSGDYRHLNEHRNPSLFAKFHPPKSRLVVTKIITGNNNRSQTTAELNKSLKKALMNIRARLDLLDEEYGKKSIVDKILQAKREQIKTLIDFLNSEMDFLNPQNENKVKFVGMLNDTQKVLLKRRGRWRLRSPHSATVFSKLTQDYRKAHPVISA